MEIQKERTGQWLSVPQFGEWDQRGGAVPDYSVDFSKIREMRKKNKREPTQASRGIEEELITSVTTTSSIAQNVHHDYHQNNSPTARRSIFSYFNCCVKA